MDLPTKEFNRSLPLGYRIFRLFLKLAARLLFRVEIRGEENVPEGNYVVVANHLNWIDPFLLMLALPAEPRVYFLGAQQIINRPWKAWLLKHCDAAILVERGARWVGKDIFAKPLQVLQDGAVLALFPEGDNGPSEGQLGPLQRGIGHFLVRADYPVLPVALSGTKELYWGKPLQVTIGRPFHAHADAASRHAAISQATDQVAQHLRAVLPPYEEPRVGQKHMRFLTNLLG